MDDRNIVSNTFYILEGMHIHGLAHAASGYHKVLLENRKLYNQVQDLKGTEVMLVRLCLASKLNLIFVFFLCLIRKY